MAQGREEPCNVQRATLGEKGQPTSDISTDQMEVAAARVGKGVLVIDARPVQEFAMGHIPGAVNLAPRSDASDVAEIEKLTMRRTGAPIIVYCDGPFCSESVRLANDLLAAGYTQVSRYQLGIPLWRALGHPVQAEAEAIRTTLEEDRTAVVIDTRDPASFGKGSLRAARNVPFEEVAKAKDDGRLSTLDHGTRLFVVGENAAQALVVAQEIARDAFQNVAYYAGPIQDLIAASR
jgi:rhodanese-related sulfurtransferase